MPSSRLGCPLSLKTPNMGNPGSNHPRTDFHTSDRRSMNARGFPHRGHGHGAKEEMCVEREKTPILYKRVLLYSHFRSRPVWGRGCPRQRLRPPESCRPPGPRSCQLARCPRTLPHHFDGLSARPGAPVSRRSPRSWAVRGPRAGFLEVGTGVDQGQCRPRAGHCRRLWERLWERRLELGANTYGVLVLFTTLSRIQGDLDVRVTRRSPWARASVRDTSESRLAK